MKLIDQFLPTYHFAEQHSRPVRATAHRAAAMLPTLDLSNSWLIRRLFWLRGLPVCKLGTMLEQAFTVLHDDPMRGIVVGSVGRPWRIGGGQLPLDGADEFLANQASGCARFAWSFQFSPTPDGGCTAHSEARVSCNDESALWPMSIYWLFAKPANSLMRREILRLLANRCSTRR